MRAARVISSLGRTVRTDARVKVRQPLARAVIHFPGDPAALEPLLELIAEELNVREVAFAESAKALAGWRAKPNYRALGPRLGSRVNDVAAALEGDDGSVAAALAGGRSVTLQTASGAVEVAPDEVELSQQTTGGWGMASEGGLTVALDLEITPALAAEGLARELVRLVQDARKSAGLDVADRIEVTVEASGPVRDAIAAHRDWIAGEVLATALEIGKATSQGDGSREERELDGHWVAVAIRKT